MNMWFAKYKRMAAVLALFLVLGGVSIASAKKEKDGDFGVQMDRLAQQVERLVDVISGEKEELSEVREVSEEGTSLQSARNNMQNSACLDNWEEWPRSNVQNTNAAWSLNEMPYRHYANFNILRQFIDINGDGLVDIIHHESRSSELRDRKYSRRYPTSPETVASVPSGNFYNNELSCVMLNNGAGWDVVFQCKTSEGHKERVGDIEEAEVVYHGDCAQL